MRFFKEMVSTARTYGLLATNSKSPFKPADKNFDKALEEAQPYIFHTDYWNAAIERLESELTEPLLSENQLLLPQEDQKRIAYNKTISIPSVQRGLESLPFSSVSVELEHQMSDFDLFVEDVNEYRKDKLSCSLKNILLYETSPFSYRVYANLLLRGDKGNHSLVIELTSPYKFSKLYLASVLLVGLLFCPDKHKTVGVEKVREKIKIGKGFEKRFVHIEKVLHISPYNKQTDGYHSNIKQIEWSNRWLVSGHWRRLYPEQIGKDRHDNYVVPGYTWVHPFEKGGGSQRFKSRVRFVNNGNAHKAITNVSLVNSLMAMYS